MKKISVLLALFFITFNCAATKISCNELLNFIVSKGYTKSSLSSYVLNSSWLYKVTAYSYNNDIYVVAEVKRSEYSFSTDTYIFCGIPSTAWSNFQYGSYGDSESYGSRFNKYIMDYKCDCD